MLLKWAERIILASIESRRFLFGWAFITFAQSINAVVPVGPSIELTWGPSPGATVAGYYIYFGVQSGVYTSTIDVGNVTTATVSGLVSGVTYYFAATAYDGLGQESEFSNEVKYSVPLIGNVIMAPNVTAVGFSFNLTGLPGHTYQVQATQDFIIWTNIGSMSMGPGGIFEFIDTDLYKITKRFYRTIDLQP